jgi:hypothetical protein
MLPYTRGFGVYLKKNDNLQKNPLDGLIVRVGSLDADSEKMNALFWASLKNS